MNDQFEGNNPSAPPAQASDPLLDQRQAAAYLTLKPGTLEVWRCTKRHGLEYVRVGRSVRYRKSALDAFLASRTVAA